LDAISVIILLGILTILIMWLVLSKKTSLSKERIAGISASFFQLPYILAAIYSDYRGAEYHYFLYFASLCSAVITYFVVVYYYRRLYRRKERSKGKSGTKKN
jgi:SNF family Na+-dependent transporter